MSVDYYLVCKRHRTAVYIVDNKGNPIEREAWRIFHDEHVVSADCYQELAFLNEWDVIGEYEIIHER